MNQILKLIGFFIVLSWYTSTSCRADEPLTDEQVKFFESKIRPVLVRECYGCHSTQVGQIKGGLWLDTADGVFSGGDSGPAVVAGNLEESLLWSAINFQDYKMPPGKKLSAEVIADFRAWIEMGAPDPRVTTPTKVHSSISEQDLAEGRNFWSFKKPETQIPPVIDSDWPQTDVDRFVAKQLADHDLQPAPDADAATVLRRLTFDLIGLPPTPAQIDEFQSKWKQSPPEAIESMVDELLAMPQFGERWGRHWLDVARYAESTGRELNMTYPHAWRYRDYVIDSFNADKPYDRFVQEQLAGDLLPVTSDEEWMQNLVATGFLVVGPKLLSENNARQFELDLIDDQIDVTTQVMLGVSVACARCHDHKFDPIPQTDYYALAGIFRNTTTHFGTFQTRQNRRSSNLIVAPVNDLNPFDKPVSKQQLAQWKQQLADTRLELQTAMIKQRQARTQNANQATARASIANVFRLQTAIGILESKLETYDENGQPFTFCMAVQESENMTDVRLLERGEFNKPAQVVRRGFPQVLCVSPVNIEPESSGRLEFARWVGSSENPLTARVMVNRIWLHLFGNGIVRTPENFAATGMQPTHPELLDYLAVQFMEQQWSVKQTIRQLVTSRIYRTSSRFDEDSFRVDPENKFLWRFEPSRLDAEALRDAMLAISGQLDSERPRASLVAQAGPALVRDGLLVSSDGMSQLAKNVPKTEMDATMSRQAMRQRAETIRSSVVRIDQPTNYRSVYLPIVRDSVPRSLEVFDFAESTMVVGQRESSTTPDQGLYFLNNAFVIAQSDALAKRLIQDNEQPKGQIKQAFLLAFGRPATASELRAAERFYQTFRPTTGIMRRSDDAVQKLSALCQSIFASAEFRFLN